MKMIQTNFSVSAHTVRFGRRKSSISPSSLSLYFEIELETASFMTMTTKFYSPAGCTYICSQQVRVPAYRTIDLSRNNQF